MVNVRRHFFRLPGGGRAHRPVTRVLATGVVVASMSALAACGGADDEQVAGTAAANLSSAKSASFAFHLSDPKGSLASGAATAQDAKALKFVTDSTLSVTIDPAGDSTLGHAATTQAGSGSDPAAALKSSGAVALDFTHAGKQVVGLRMIDGVLYVRADVKELSDLSGESVTDGLAGAPPVLAPVTDGLKAGKWLTLDVPALLAQYPQLNAMASGAGGAAASPQAMLQLRTKLLEAFRTNSTQTVTTSGGETVTHLAVKAKPFLTAAFDAIDGAGLPGTSSLARAKEQLGSMSDGTVDVTLTVKDGHYAQAALDAHSVAMLGSNPAAKVGTEGVQVLVDIDDQASGVSAPATGQVVDLNSLVAAALSELSARGLDLSALTSGLAGANG